MISLVFQNNKDKNKIKIKKKSTLKKNLPDFHNFLEGLNDFSF